MTLEGHEQPWSQSIKANSDTFKMDGFLFSEQCCGLTRGNLHCLIGCSGIYTQRLLVLSCSFLTSIPVSSLVLFLQLQVFCPAQDFACAPVCGECCSPMKIYPPSLFSLLSSSEINYHEHQVRNVGSHGGIPPWQKLLSNSKFTATSIRWL